MTLKKRRQVEQVIEETIMSAPIGGLGIALDPLDAEKIREQILRALVQPVGLALEPWYERWSDRFERWLGRQRLTRMIAGLDRRDDDDA